MALMIRMRGEGLTLVSACWILLISIGCKVL